MPTELGSGRVVAGSDAARVRGEIDGGADPGHLGAELAGAGQSMGVAAGILAHQHGALRLAKPFHDQPVVPQQAVRCSSSEGSGGIGPTFAARLASGETARGVPGRLARSSRRRRHTGGTPRQTFCGVSRSPLPISGDPFQVGLDLRDLIPIGRAHERNPGRSVHARSAPPRQPTPPPERLRSR